MQAGARSPFQFGSRILPAASYWERVLSIRQSCRLPQPSVFPSNPGTQAQSCTAPRASVGGRPRHRTRRVVCEPFKRCAAAVLARFRHAGHVQHFRMHRSRRGRHSVARLLSFPLRCKCRDRCISARQVVLPAMSIALRIPRCGPAPPRMPDKQHVRQPRAPSRFQALQPCAFSDFFAVFVLVDCRNAAHGPTRLRYALVALWPRHPCRHPSAGAGRRSSAYRVPLRNRSCPDL